MPTSSEWLANEDGTCFDDRKARLDWLGANSSLAMYWTFPGGLSAKSLFEEARYSFVYGQFLAIIFLGLAYIERTLAAVFYGEGRNDLERANLSLLLREAEIHGLIGSSEARDLDEAREGRNAYVHFRRPGHEDSLEARAVHEDEAPYDLIEREATAVMSAAFMILNKNVVR